MSHADVLGNIVVDNAETGIQLLDMSMAHICDNIVSDTRGSSDAPQIRQGNGIIIDYHSEATLVRQYHPRQRPARHQHLIRLHRLLACKHH